jgi:uncharacterized protein (DUF924 family)
MSALIEPQSAHCLRGDYRAMASPEDILQFWFGTSADDAEVIQAKSSLWWHKSPETDRRITERYGDDLERAIRGELDHWARTPRGRLALILLCDQFSRNICRGTPKAFAQDDKACGLCLAGLKTGQDRVLRPIERVFFYLPLEHAEALPLQHHSVALFQALCREVSSDLKPAFQDFLEYALRHRDIIRHFGRFPHRNVILSRASTPDEVAFLRRPGTSF